MFWVVCVLFLAVSGDVARAQPRAKQDSMDQANLLPHTFIDRNGDGFPDGYKRRDGHRERVSYDRFSRARGGGPVIRINMPELVSVYLDSEPFHLEKGKRYLFSVEIRMKDIDFPAGKSKWEPKAYTFVAYVYAVGSNTHIWTWITHKGSTQGWVTLMLPFDTIKHSALSHARILLRCRKLRGTVWLRDPTIVELPNSMKIPKHFILRNGHATMSPDLVLEGRRVW